MANASVQISVDPELRGRVMGLYMLVFVGGTPIGAPVIGAITSHYGARTGMLVCGLVPAAAAVIAAVAGRERSSRHPGLTTGTLIRMLNGTAFRLFNRSREHGS
jgi:predicted MFS family arabinose efflux permease